MRVLGIPLQKSRAKPRRADLLARDAAKAFGLLTYVGKPCARGHPDGVRYVSSGTCIECSRESAIRSHAKQLRGGRRRSEDTRIASEVQRAKRRAKAKLYQARAAAAGKRCSAADVRWLQERQAGKCAICLLKIGKLAWDIDHRVPLVADGTNDRANLQITHARCNRQKGRHDEIKFAQEKFGRLL